MREAFATRPALWLILAIFCAASMAHYVYAIWSFNQPEHFSDLYAPWWGAHEMFLHGRNPYSPEVAHEIQRVIYGAAQPSSPADPTGIAGGFAYPAYAAFLLWPLIHLSFGTAQTVFLCASVLLTVLSVGLWLRMFHFRTFSLSGAAIQLLVLGSFPALQAFQLENLSVLAAAIISIAIFLLYCDRQISAGILLALATFKPQFTIALLLWIGLWTAADWRRRRAAAVSFAATLLLLLLISQWLVPGWLADFLRIIRAYRHYTYGRSLLDIWLTPSLGTIVAAGLLLGVLALFWRCRLQPANSPFFLSAASAMLAANVVIMPTLAPHAQLLLVPGFLFLFRERTALWNSGPGGRLLAVAVASLMAWPWIAALGLLVAALGYPASRLAGFWKVPLYTSPLLPLAVLLALSYVLLPRRSAAGGRSDPKSADGFGLNC